MMACIKQWLRSWLGVASPTAFEPREPSAYDEVTAFVRGDPGPWDEPQPEPPCPPRSSVIVELGPFEVPVFGVRTLGTWEGRAS